MPTEMRIRSSVKPLDSRTEAGMLAWDMKHGKLMRDLTLPAKNEHCKLLSKSKCNMEGQAHSEKTGLQ